MPYLHYPGLQDAQPHYFADLAPRWASKVSFASITGVPDNMDAVTRIRPAIQGTVSRRGTAKGLASYTGGVSSGLVWSTLRPVPSIFNTGMSFLIFAKPNAGGTIQRAFFLGDELPAVSNQYNQACFAFNCTKTGTASSGIFTAFEYNFGFQGSAESTAGTVDGGWHVFIASRPAGFGTWTLYRDGRDVTAGGFTSANGVVLTDGCRVHIHPGLTQGYPDDAVLAVAFEAPLTLTEVRELSANPWQIFEAQSFSWFFDPAAGGTAYSQSLAGSVTFAGALTKQTNKAVAGSSTPAGSIVKLTSRNLAGLSTFSGNIVKQTAKAFAGSVTGSGSLATMILFTASMGGSITPSGAIAKMTIKALAGASTFAGAISKMTAKGLGGEVTLTGALSRLTAKAFAGSVTVAGSLAESYQVLKSLAGSITPTGALGAVYIAFVAGVLKLLALMGVGQ